MPATSPKARPILLETEWVLRSVYGHRPKEVADALHAFSGLPGVTLESPALVARALACVKNGMDFADALHLGAAANCEAILTFDRRLIEAASGGPTRVTEP